MYLFGENIISIMLTWLTALPPTMQLLFWPKIYCLNMAEVLFWLTFPLDLFISLPPFHLLPWHYCVRAAESFTFHLPLFHCCTYPNDFFMQIVVPWLLDRSLLLTVRTDFELLMYQFNCSWLICRMLCNCNMWARYWTGYFQVAVFYACTHQKCFLVTFFETTWLNSFRKGAALLK